MGIIGQGIVIAMLYIGVITYAIGNMTDNSGNIQALVRVQGCEYITQLETIVFMQCGKEVKTFVSPY
jgi:hypothetical protein